MIRNAQKPILALDIAPMGERQHTGIANVAKHLALEMLSDDSVDARFFMIRGEIPRRTVEQLVELSCGDILWWLARRLDAKPTFNVAQERLHIGIFTAVKYYRRLFPFEVQIVHDLTTITAPQTHTAESVAHWQDHLLGDILSSDLVVTVSESTRTDLHDFFPATRKIPSLVAHLASCVRATPLGAAENRLADYVLVLGTLEPRKNVRLVLECLSNYPELLALKTFVFVGRWGWGGDVRGLISDLGLASYLSAGRIVFTGFVEDELRDQLIAAAQLVLYPSRYEGFGLPVLEALGLGVPVLTSYCASLPEVGGDVAYYCDMDSPPALYKALIAIFAEQSDNDFRHKQREACQVWAQRFSWKQTYRKIRDVALELVDKEQAPKDAASAAI